MSQQCKNKGGGFPWYLIATMLLYVAFGMLCRFYGITHGINQKSCYAAMPRSPICQVMP